MTFDQFSRVAQEAFQSFPEAYREGIEGVTTVEAVEAHPELPGMVTLGECITQAYNSDWQSPETTRSRVVLYYGSFLRMEQDDPDFSWEGELRETLTHELQHHLESLAGEDALEAMDYATDEAFKRERDDPFDPLYFQWGEPMGEGMYRVEDEVYIERVLTAAEVDHLEEIDFTWEGQAYRIPRPDELGDVHFVVVEGIDTYIQIVLIRQASWRRRLRAHVRSEGPVVLESGAEARRVAPNGDEVGRHDTGDLQEHSRLRVVLTSDAFRALQVSQAPPLNSRCLDISVYLQHPHILALFDSGEADSFLCYGER